MNVSEFSQWARSQDWLFVKEKPSFHRVPGSESKIELWLSPEGRLLCAYYTNGELTTVVSEKD
ncbi:hypothetical protein LCGC14_3066660 [marine sediment metagenome]|uniref:Uncharacterized protein n=1 Tax=marine sediment metagenome TaxID=412755 RepID=A0A0F8X5K8_9ZZZZ